MSTLSDVAALAGVSVSAVSRVLSDAPSARVSPGTRKRIHDAALELAYRPNFTARALKLSRTNVIALVVPDLTNALFTELMRGVEEEAELQGYMVLLARTESMPGQEAIARLIGEGRVDGVLVQAGDSMRAEDLASLLEGTVPAVLINSTHRGHIGSVAVQDELAARIATQHLIDLGHSRIALINGLASANTAQRRGIGFAAAMADAGLDMPPAFVTNFGYEPRQGGRALRDLVSVHPAPTAIVVANVNAALGVLLEARTLDLRVPEDLSIVAIHDTWIAETTWPPITTVKMPLYEMGRRAMAAIIDRISNGTVSDEIISSAPQLIVRESTREMGSA